MKVKNPPVYTGLGTYYVNMTGAQFTVMVEIHPAEPDVGIFGNGKIAIEIIGVYEEEHAFASEDLTDRELEFLSDDVYSQIEEASHESKTL